VPHWRAGTEPSAYAVKVGYNLLWVAVATLAVLIVAGAMWHFDV
jgi:hypothetical protein